jgi:hypothetical protein
MRRFLTSIVAIALCAPAARAQGGLSSAHLGGAFGISFPVGGLSRDHASGFNLSGSAEFEAPMELMGVRGEVFYEHFPASADAAGAHAAQASAAIINAVYHFQGVSYHPYLIGGMGVYNTTGNGTNPGFNGGMGIKIPLSGMTAYFEARLHKVLTNGSSYVSFPISFGLSF